MCECLVDEHGEWLCPVCTDELRAQVAAAEARVAELDLDLKSTSEVNDKLREDLSKAEDLIDIMGCGHPQNVVVTSNEGTSYCEMCRLESDVKHWKKKHSEIKDYLSGLVDIFDV